MQLLHKKILGMSICLTLTGAGSLALLKVTERTQTSGTNSPSRAHAAAPATPSGDNPDHELKELGAQLKKKPGHTPILLRMAQLQREAGKLDQAIADWKEVMHNEPGNTEAHLELGRALYEKGDVQGGIAETEAVLKINPSQVDALYNLGAIYANLGNRERARTYWSRAVSADPKAESSRKAQEGLRQIGAA